MLRKTLCVCAALAGLGILVDHQGSEARAQGVQSGRIENGPVNPGFSRLPRFDDYFLSVGGYSYGHQVPLQHYLDIRDSYVHALPPLATPGLFPAVPPGWEAYHVYAPVTIPPRPTTVVPIAVVHRW